MAHLRRFGEHFANGLQRILSLFVCAVAFLPFMFVLAVHFIFFFELAILIFCVNQDQILIDHIINLEVHFDYY